MIRSGLPAPSTVLQCIRTILYREMRDVYWGLPWHPRWFLRRKMARFESMKALVNYRRRRTPPRDVQHAVSQQANTVFRGINVEWVIDCLRQDGACFGLTLPINIVHQIVQYARETRCYGNGKPYLGFYYHEKEVVSKKIGVNLSTADYYNTHHCEAVRSVVEDPVLLQIAGGYLGGLPVHQGTKLRWSCCVDSSDYEKYKYNQKFHYDLDDYCALKFFFYLTDVGIDDGPHICILGSHKLKKFSYKALRGIHHEQDMINFYKNHNTKTIYGNSGYGFVEDVSIIHKGLTPMRNDRLILIIEYALRDYDMQHDRMQESQLKCIQ